MGVVAPFLAWRCLVLANPVWYPRLTPASRARLLGFAVQVLKTDHFEPELGDQLFVG